MQNLKIILNIYQSPNNILRYLIDNNKHLYLPISGGSKLINCDKWCNNNLIFDIKLFDNISNLNYKLNEMTSIYACWKNYNYMTNPNYIGFNHYRRLFNPKDFTDFEKYDILVGKRYKFNNTLLEQYKNVHHEFDINVMIGLLQKYFNKDEILNFMNQTELYAPCNMFIMKKELFFNYCNFIFPILFKLEKMIKLDTSNKYQFRALAFLSERLTSFWMKMQLKQNKNIKEIPIVFFKEWKK